ncbi:hypothetical protein JTE90_001029, partial [Oedothorax gibbosus]
MYDINYQYSQKKWYPAGRHAPQPPQDGALLPFSRRSRPLVTDSGWTVTTRGDCATSTQSSRPRSLSTAFLDKVKIANWMHEMKDEFLMLDNFNVIVVDWSFGNFIPYTKAAANTEPVGEEIARLLISLIEQYGAKPEKFHLIGHSLGSHVAGYVGERVKGLKRIT